MTAILTRAERPYDPADISSPEFWAGTAKDREKVFAELRANRPISWHRPVQNGLFADPNDQGFWAIVRHADLVEVTRRPQDFLSGEGILFESMPKELLDAGQGFIAMDPPRHTKIRRLVAAAFTPKQLARIDDHIIGNARRIVDDIADKGQIDFVSDVAALVPMHNICDMVGIPEEHRRTIAYESQFPDGWRDPRLLQGAEPLARVAQAILTVHGIAMGLVEARRRKPENDLVTALVQAEVDGERLSDEEISSIFFLLIIAGNDTTRQSISHGMKALTDFPEQRAWLMEDLDARLPIAVEEIIRWATPIMTFRRTAAHDTELGGHHITAGDKVILFYSSANMDTEVFDHPEQLNLSRSPNKHVAFGGGGIHHCLGAQLARRQINATFRELLTRLPDIHTVGEPELGNGNFFHTVMSMTAQFTPETSKAAAR
ncbi:MAG: cytochrome P450 [Actinomycetota bacterium]|nr:cytochrome P450 [Actinomycetota bacterium]MDA2947913.1 cytochrome P450 [Actinomycetota bacterium]